jgi:hypothetical protein
MNNGPVGDPLVTAVQRHGLASSTWKTRKSDRKGRNSVETRLLHTRALCPTQLSLTSSRCAIQSRRHEVEKGKTTKDNNKKMERRFCWPVLPNSRRQEGFLRFVLTHSVCWCYLYCITQLSLLLRYDAIHFIYLLLRMRTNFQSHKRLHVRLEYNFTRNGGMKALFKVT